MIHQRQLQDITNTKQISVKGNKQNVTFGENVTFSESEHDRILRTDKLPQGTANVNITLSESDDKDMTAILYTVIPDCPEQNSHFLLSQKDAITITIR